MFFIFKKTPHKYTTATAKSHMIIVILHFINVLPKRGKKSFKKRSSAFFCLFVFLLIFFIVTHPQSLGMYMIYRESSASHVEKLCLA